MHVSLVFAHAMGSPEKTFQRLVAQLDYPIFIATVAADGERIVERVEFGDHLGIVLEPFYAEEDETCGQPASTAPSGSTPATKPE